MAAGFNEFNGRGPGFIPLVSVLWSGDCLPSAGFNQRSAPGLGRRWETLRCLYCGKEVWLPSRIRQDPDFCSPDHREKYNNRVDLAMQRIKESSAMPVSEPMAAPAMEIPAPQTRSHVTHSGPVAPQSKRSGRLLPFNMPRMAVRPIFERLEEKNQNAQQRDSKAPAFAEIFSLPEAAAITRRNARRYGISAAAAAVIGAMALWFGGNAGEFGRDLAHRGDGEIAGSSLASTLAPTPAPEPSAFRHPLDWVRRAAIKRSITQLGDSFEGGMVAWGNGSKGWVPGWSRSPDGYVRPGQLALFQPTLGYADYRLDFFGQVEKSSMSWVVRGKDTQNYYAMKVNILKAGLRPVLSMVHYPVVQGRQGHKVELPLSVMIHNGMPYHVSVEVKGSHYTASIEGEEVDSWSDDTLLAGGVGFFSDTGERARIYWIKVSQNDDWLGRLCGQIVPSGKATAGLERPAPAIPLASAMLGLGVR